MRIVQQDNQHLALKVALRQETMRVAGCLSMPCVCETHGGTGDLARLCYADATGMVIDRDTDRVDRLAFTRPTWQVYEGDAPTVLASGLGAETAWDVLDCDPYGSPWTTLEAFFVTPRALAPIMALIVTDGSRQKQRLGGTVYGWEPWQEHYGQNLWDVFLRCSRDRATALVRHAGYALSWWHGRYGGRTGQMTYWGAVLRQREDRYSDEPAQAPAA